MLYKTLVRSHLEYANCVWSPFRQIDVKKVERVQMRATRMVMQLKNSSYEDRLKVLNLPTLKYRRLRGDTIQVYNIIFGVHDTYSSLQFNMSNVSITRGNQCKIQLTHIHYNLQKHYFPNRVIDVWNSLPNEVVSADSITFLSLVWINAGVTKI